MRVLMSAQSIYARVSENVGIKTRFFLTGSAGAACPSIRIPDTMDQFFYLPANGAPAAGIVVYQDGEDQ